ncbi:MAG: hypothetical protein M5R41_04595 [Bacteroidia bacterium]|nr:hypothetical protein [Bacteroidia bacterium]
MISIACIATRSDGVEKIAARPGGGNSPQLTIFPGKREQNSPKSSEAFVWML